MDSIKVLNDMLKCSDCGHSFTLDNVRKKDIDQLIDFFIHNLPAVKYVSEQLVNYIFSNNLTTGDEEQDKKLDLFMYSNNIEGKKNLTVLKEAVTESILYGKSGIRYLSRDDGLVNVSHNNYATLLKLNNTYLGFNDVIGYLINSNPKEKMFNDIKKLNDDRFFDDFDYENGLITLNDRKLVFETKNNFINLRRNTTKEEGESPFEYDRQRVGLIYSVYSRLNYDVEYDGVGRLLLRLEKDISELPQGTTEMFKETESENETQIKKIKAEVEAVAKLIKNSDKTSVIALSNVFGEVERLQRDTRSVEFFNWLEKDVEMIAQVFGINPPLINAGRNSGNISQEKIIDNAMLNTIIPLREQFALQISNMIAPKIGVERIFFDKYEMKQKEDETDKLNKLTNAINTLNNIDSDEAKELQKILIEGAIEKWQ
ncbi:TPA: hypothetical protein ACN3BD_000968 [Enterococcus faecalis]|nr:hypothetical protein [Enterococcus faecalis]